MNINDFKPLNINPLDIFKLQQELKFQFEPQAKEDFRKFDIDTFESQEVIRKYAWRITEEVTEMLEAYYHDALPGEKEHVYEEAIDAFNFFIELCCLVGYTPEKMGPFKSIKECKRPVYGTMTPDPEECALEIVYRLGMVCNHLKSREWRRSQYLVDLYRFWPDYEKLWVAFMELFACFGWTEEDVAEKYSLKYQVNKFRIETSY